MSRTLLNVLLSLILAGPALAQVEPPVPETAADDVAAKAAPTEAAATEAAPTEAAAAPAAEPDIVDADFEDAELDVQTYEEDDDDFVPSEEIPADEPIPFPSNI